MSTKSSQSWLLWLSVGVSSLPVAIFAFGTVYMRYIADDFCIKALSMRLGWWDAVLYVYQGWTGTFSGLAFQALAPAPEHLAIPIFLTLVAWLWLLYLAVHRLTSGLMLDNQSLISLALACILCAVFLSSLPSMGLHQSLYWYTGFIPYTLPTVIALLYILLLGRLKGAWSALFFFALSFVLAGFNPGFTGAQLVWLGLFSLFTLRRKGIRWQLLSSLLGASLGFVIVAVAPGNAFRIALSATSLDWVRALALLPQVLELLVGYMFFNAPLGTLALCVVPAIFAYYLGKPLAKKRVVTSSILICSLATGSAIVTFLPRLYIFGDFPPPPRYWTLSIASVIWALPILGYLIGLLIRADRRPAGYLPRYAQIAVVILALGVALNGVPTALQAVSRQSAYAAMWDQRDAYLRTFSGRAEIGLVYARSFRNAFEMEDLTNNPAEWTNKCIADYYDLSAVLPNGQPPFIP
ncbi:MAG: DUF6056 family protein [Aggregatilineales bacterium]